MLISQSILHKNHIQVNGTFNNKPFHMYYSLDETQEIPTTIDGNFTDEEKLQILTVWEIENSLYNIHLRSSQIKNTN